MIKALIFDNFGVLMDCTHSKLSAMFPKFADKIDAINIQADLGEISDETRDDEIAKLIGSREPVDRVVNAAKVNRELLDYILELHKHYKTGILSATGANFWRYFDAADLRARFNDVLLSYQVHLTKPNPAIFRLAAQRLGVKTDECVFVDDIPANIAAAENVGMRGILYKNFVQFRQELNAILERNGSRADDGNSRDDFAKGESQNA